MSWPNKDPHTGNSPQFAGVVSLHLSLVNDQVGVTLKGAIPIADTTRVFLFSFFFLGGGAPPPPFQLSALIYAIVCFSCDWCAFDILKEKETGECVCWGGGGGVPCGD